MKRIICVLTAFFLVTICSSNVFAQNEGDRLSCSDGRIYLSDGTEVSADMAVELFGKELCTETFEEAVRQAEIGSKLISPGIILSAAGLGTALMGVIMGISTVGEMGAISFAAGISAMIAGDLLLSVGIPLKSISVSRLNWLTDQYNSGALQAQKSPMISFRAQKHGVGLAINF